MAPLKTITLITKDDSLGPVEGPTGLLFECAPDAELPGDPAQRISFRELMGPYEDAKAWAVRTTHRLIANEPLIEGIRHLEIVEESIIQELERIFHVLRLHTCLAKNQVENVVFRSDSPFADSLADPKLNAPYSVQRPAIGSAKLVSKGLRSAGDQGLAATLRLAAERNFPCAARLFLSDRKRGRPQVGAAWLYSTAYTYTTVLLDYERFIPGPVQFLYESSGSSGHRLLERNDSFDLFAWGSRSDIPSRRMVEEARAKLVRHMEDAALEAEDSLARTLLLGGSMFRAYLLRRLPIFIFKARLARKWLLEVKPRMVVVGNPGTERPLLQLAHESGIPTVCLQHGILGDYYQYCTQPCDSLVVRGPFWKEFVVAPMRKRTRILNPAPTPSSARERRSDGAILFVSSIESALPTTHPTETSSLIRALLQCAQRERRTLIVRVHPREPLEHYRRLTAKEMRTLPGKVEVEFSQGPGLDDILRRSSVAVMYSSTVFLDCLRHGVPIVSLDWLDFSYKELLEKHGVFHFAKSYAELQQLVLQGTRGELPSRSSFEDFLAETTETELRDFFQGALQPRPGLRSVGQ